ncbi:hypothetical protein NKR23_g11997 [Pleurostoma richardsiae]|uniref:Uncharacterized protein n=1 Tax=Pleurostoma richardsiae TaxID=41990 RepID=A0AA38R8S0_9PEZI|nr:hypothetical protein NKR23_g11997 [Pleurostoma richardsiae]
MDRRRNRGMGTQEKYFIYQLEKQDVRALSSEDVKSVYGGHLSEHTIRRIPIKKGSRKVDVVLPDHSIAVSQQTWSSTESQPSTNSTEQQRQHQQKHEEEQQQQHQKASEVAIHVATVTIPFHVMLQRYTGLYKEMFITTDHCC